MRIKKAWLLTTLMVGILVGCPSPLSTDGAPAVVETPVFSPAPGDYSADQSIEISSETAGVTLYYTTDGTQPSVDAMIYDDPIPLLGDNAVLELKAVAVLNNGNESSVITGQYQIEYSRTPRPTFLQPPGVYDSDQQVEMVGDTEEDSIYFTIDGTTPTQLSTRFDHQISIAGNGSETTIKAIAVRPGYRPSNQLTGQYSIQYEQTATPTFSTPPGMYSSDVSVGLSSATSLSTIYYTTDGSVPDPTSAVYDPQNPIAIAGDGSSVIINAYAVRGGMLDSSTVLGEFSVNYPLTAPANLRAVSVGFDTVELAWDVVSVAEEYVLYRYSNVSPGPPSSFTSFVWKEVYRGTASTFVDTGLWGGNETYYKVAAIHDTKGTKESPYIRVDTLPGEIAFTHNLFGGYSYWDENAFGYKVSSPSNGWVLLVANYNNNQSDSSEVYAKIVVVGSGTTFNDSASGVFLSPGSTDYELTNTSVTFTNVGAVGERVTGHFSGYYGTTPVSGSFSMIRVSDS